MRPTFRLRKKRSIHLTIAAATLVVPASAVALTSTSAIAGPSTDNQAAAPGTSLSLRVTPRHPQYNRPFNVSGKAPAPAAGQTISLQTASGRSAAWRTLSTSQVGQTGDFRLRGSLKRSGLIRVVPGSPGPVATAVRAPVAASATGASAPRPIEVSPQLRVERGSQDILGASPLRVRGRMLPAIAGRTVRLQAHSAHGWHTVTTARTGRAGGFTLRATAASGTERRLRVAFRGDANNARAMRPAGRLTVYGASVASWYDDSGATACGFHAGYGLANRTLPCGTKVRIRYGGRSVTAVVDDRGPFVGGRDWDLNQNTAAALGFNGVGTVWTSL